MAYAVRFRQRAVDFLLVLQIVSICGVLLVVEARRIGDDAVLLVPVSQAARRALPARALDGRNRLVCGGLLPGSLVIRPEDGASLPLWRDGVIAIRVPLQLCGRGKTA